MNQAFEIYGRISALSTRLPRMAAAPNLNRRDWALLLYVGSFVCGLYLVAPMELDYFIKVVATAGTLGLALSHWIRPYSSFRLNRFNLSSKRTERFYKLIADGSWKTANPMKLQMSYADAFGKVIDARYIRFALGRENPIALLRAIRRCAGVVKLSPDASHLVRAGGFKLTKYSYRRHSQALFISGFLPSVIVMIAGFYIKHLTPYSALAYVFGALLVWIPVSMLAAGYYETAHHLVEALDTLHPAWNGESGLREKIRSHVEPLPDMSKDQREENHVVSLKR